ncbi:MAG: ABC transporter substrate-binding protein [Oscillospiraceae bacterium]|nr:ABC transporter substrate-binding protein [Oscillospiraceae bacterium]
MKLFKVMIAVLLVTVLLAALFTGCAKTEQGGQPAAEPGKTESTTPSKPEESETAATEEPVDPEDVEDIIFWIPDMNNAGGVDHGERIEKLVNEISEPLGIHVTLVYLSGGDYRTKSQLSISGGEQIDLMCYWIGNNVLSMYTANMAMELDDLLKNNAPETFELMKDYLPATTFGGKIYSVPVLRNYVTNGYLCFNQDMLDQYGLSDKARNLTSWSEYEEILREFAEKAAGSGVWASITTELVSNAFVMHGDKFSDIEVVDVLGDRLGVVYCSPDGKVSLNQAKEEYIAACEKSREWYDNGWVFPDSLYNTETLASEWMSNGVAASELCTSEEGIEVTKTSWYRAPAICVKVYDGVISTSTMTSWGMGIPVSAQEPETAAKFLNLLYTNADLMKVLVNGEEGVDYDLIDGQAQPKEKQYNMGNYVLGNNLLALPLYGNGADFYDRVGTANNNAERSKFMGFVLDTGDYQTLVGSITAVNDQYTTSMRRGGYTREMYDEYMGKLETAGVQEYLDVVQTQLDAWRASR